MKILLGLLLSFSVHASQTDSIDESLRIAKAFCASNVECIDVLALELDSSYEDGVRASSSKNSWNVSINKKTKQLNNLCDKAPNKKVCYAYRDQLLIRYIDGLSK